MKKSSLLVLVVTVLSMLSACAVFDGTSYHSERSEPYYGSQSYGSGGHSHH